MKSYQSPPKPRASFAALYAAATSRPPHSGVLGSSAYWSDRTNWVRSRARPHISDTVVSADRTTGVNTIGPFQLTPNAPATERSVRNNGIDGGRLQTGSLGVFDEMRITGRDRCEIGQQNGLATGHRVRQWYVLGKADARVPLCQLARQRRRVHDVAMCDGPRRQRRGWRRRRRARHARSSSPPEPPARRCSPRSVPAPGAPGGRPD